MPNFLVAHGYDPGPTQRPLLAGAVSGVLATVPAIALLQLFGSLEVEARILGIAELTTVAVGWPIMAAAGAAYARLFGRAANNPRGGWLFGMAFGFALWAAGAVLVLPLVGAGQAPAGEPALGVFLSLVLWGAVLGTALPFIHRRLRKPLGSVARHARSGPSGQLPETKR